MDTKTSDKTSVTETDTKPKDPVVEADKTVTPTPPLDPVKAELEKIKGKGEGRTEREKLLFTQNKLKERLRALDEEEGIAPTLDEDDDKPMTVGTFKKFQREQTVKTAENLADEQVTDPNENELVKYHLKNTIRSTGNPSEDLKIARSIVNSVKSQQILAEVDRTKKPKAHVSGAGSPGKGEDVFEPTAEEQVFMKAPFNLSKDQILANRKREQEAGS